MDMLHIVSFTVADSSHVNSKVLPVRTDTFFVIVVKKWNLPCAIKFLQFLLFFFLLQIRTLKVRVVFDYTYQIFAADFPDSVLDCVSIFAICDAVH